MFHESRLLHFQETTSNHPVPAAESGARIEKKDERTMGEMVDGILGLHTPGMKELSTMSDEDYTTALKSQSAEDLLPITEAGKDVLSARDAMTKDLERVMGSGPTSLQNLDLRRLIVVMEETAEKNIKPLLAKYKGRELEILSEMYKDDFRRIVRKDKERLTRFPGEKVKNPVRDIVSMLDRFVPSSYDRLLQKELKKGRNLAALRTSYEKMKLDAEQDSMEQTDANGMLKAIDTLLATSKNMQKKLTGSSVFPDGMTFVIDPKDGEVVLQLSREKMETFVEKSPDAKKLPNGNIRVEVNGKPVEIRYDASEDAYEVVV